MMVNTNELVAVVRSHLPRTAKLPSYQLALKYPQGETFIAPNVTLHVSGKEARS